MPGEQSIQAYQQRLSHLERDLANVMEENRRLKHSNSILREEYAEVLEACDMLDNKDQHYSKHIERVLQHTKDLEEGKA